MESPIFIVGLHRSGSTLWTKIISKNKNICIFEELHFLSPWRKDFRYLHKKYVKNNPNNRSIWNLVNFFFSENKVSGLKVRFWRYFEKLPKDENLKNILYRSLRDSDKSLESIFKIILEDTTKYKGFERCCVKFPMFINFVPKLFEWYPASKIVHIVRDPRAILVSKKNDPGGILRKKSWSPISAFFLRRSMLPYVFIQYYWASKIHCKLQYNKNYSLFRYEDLLEKPSIVIQKLCEFIKIPFNDQMLNPKKGQYSSITGEKREGLDKEAAFRWQKAISPIEKNLMFILAKGSMRRLGYKL